QGHFIQLGDVPAGEEKSSARRIGADLLDEGRDLIMLAPVRTLPAAPLFAVDRSEIAPFFGNSRILDDPALETRLVYRFAGPLAVAVEQPVSPAANALLHERADVGFAGQVPEHLLGGQFPVDALGGEERQPFA